MDSQTLEPQILTTSNYLDWRIDMQLALGKHGYHMIIHGWEPEPHQRVKRNKFMNHSDAPRNLEESQRSVGEA